MNFSIRNLYENMIKEITFTNMIINFFLYLAFSCLTSIKSTKLVYYIVDFSEFLNYSAFSMEYLIPINSFRNRYYHLHQISYSLYYESYHSFKY